MPYPRKPRADLDEAFFFACHWGIANLANLGCTGEDQILVKPSIARVTDDRRPITNNVPS